MAFDRDSLFAFQPLSFLHVKNKNIVIVSSAFLDIETGSTNDQKMIFVYLCSVVGQGDLGYVAVLLYLQPSWIFFIIFVKTCNTTAAWLAVASEQINLFIDCKKCWMISVDGKHGVEALVRQKSNL